MKVLVKFIKIISRYVHSLVVMKKTKKKRKIIISLRLVVFKQLVSYIRAKHSKIP